jgi:hypothetical protein
MRHWVFNKYYGYNVGTSDLDIIDNGIGIKSVQPRLNIRPNDYYISIEPESFYNNDNYLFTDYGVVEKIDKPIEIPYTARQMEENKDRVRAGLPPLRKEFIHPVILKVTGEIKEYKELESYTYSLLTISNYLNPKKHFQQRYRAIREEDFETITEEKIFIARTAFGRFVNALPKESKHDFLTYAYQHFGFDDLIGIDYIEAFSLLKTYIDENIISHAKFLRETYNILNKQFEGIQIPLGEIGFSDEYSQGLVEKRRSDTLSEQIPYLEQLFSELNTNAFSEKYLAEITTNDQDEMRFQKLFDDKPLPIDTSL